MFHCPVPCMLSHLESTASECELDTVLEQSFLFDFLSQRGTVDTENILMSSREVLVKCGLEELDRSDQ